MIIGQQFWVNYELAQEQLPGLLARDNIHEFELQKVG
jgi:hypothetical protein